MSSHQCPHICSDQRIGHNLLRFIGVTHKVSKESHAAQDTMARIRQMAARLHCVLHGESSKRRSRLHCVGNAISQTSKLLQTSYPAGDGHFPNVLTQKQTGLSTQSSQTVKAALSYTLNNNKNLPSDTTPTCLHMWLYVPCLLHSCRRVVHVPGGRGRAYRVHTGESLCTCMLCVLSCFSWL